MNFINLMQLILFAWVSAWVFCESIMPTMAYRDKIIACAISAFVAGYANNLHGMVWRKIKQII